MPKPYPDPRMETLVEAWRAKLKADTWRTAVDRTELNS
jgi:hypothetical protein